MALTYEGFIADPVPLDERPMSVPPSRERHTGDTRDRSLLLLLGALEDLTLYATVALLRSQPDRDRALFDRARRVEGWGRYGQPLLPRSTRRGTVGTYKGARQHRVAAVRLSPGVASTSCLCS